MRIARQIYYCCVSGVLAGLLAWLVIGTVDAARWTNLWLSNAFVGAGVGGSLVLALTITRGVVEKWSWPRLLDNALVCTAIGMLAGIVGLYIGQAVFEVVRGGWAGRTASWISLSLLLGLAQAGKEGTLRRFAIGAAAGLLSGVVCGVAYEGLTQAFLATSDVAQRWASAIGLMVIGGLFAVGIPTAERLAARAVVVVRSGTRSGAEYALLDRLLVGASEECRVLIPDDPEVQPRHAELSIVQGAVRLRNLGTGGVVVNGIPVAPGAEVLCPAGTSARVGRTELGVV